jgi:hypothetical protein
MNSITCTICKTHNCWDYKIKDSEMDRGHEARGRREKCWWYFNDACEGKKLFVRTRCTLDIILKSNLKRVLHCALNIFVSGYRQLTDFCEYGSKLSDSTKED